MFGSKQKKYLQKLMEYGCDWDTEAYGYVIVEDDGRLIRTNNKAKTGLCLNKNELFCLMTIIQNNT